MSNRELAALEVSLPVISTDAATAGSTTETTTVDTNIENIKMSATTATQVNPYHDVIELSSPQGKKLHQKSTEGLPND